MPLKFLICLIFFFLNTSQAFEKKTFLINGLINEFGGIKINPDGSVSYDTSGNYRWSKATKSDPKTSEEIVTLTQTKNLDPSSKSSLMQFRYSKTEPRRLLEAYGKSEQGGVTQFFHADLKSSSEGPKRVTKCNMAGICYTVTDLFCATVLKTLGVKSIDEAQKKVQACYSLPFHSPEKDQYEIDQEVKDAKIRLNQIGNLQDSAYDFFGRNIYSFLVEKSSSGIPAESSSQSTKKIIDHNHYKKALELCHQVDYQDRNQSENGSVKVQLRPVPPAQQ